MSSSRVSAAELDKATPLCVIIPVFRRLIFFYSKMQRLFFYVLDNPPD
jgi:hypothetical protein